MEGMEVMSTLIGTLGFPIAITVFVLWMAYKLIIMNKEETKAREEKLMDSLNKQSDTLKDISVIMQSSNELNRELNETNKLLASKIDAVNEKLIDTDKRNGKPAVQSLVNK